MEYQVRPARITDVERLVALDAGAPGVAGQSGAIRAADLLRQLVSMPQASVVVAEQRRQLAGWAVLSLRPSVPAGGYVGVVDVLVVGPDHDAGGVMDALIGEVIRSAVNKGCSVVEAELPDDPAWRARWARHGFTSAGPRIERAVGARMGVGTRT